MGRGGLRKKGTDQLWPVSLFKKLLSLGFALSVDKCFCIILPGIHDDISRKTL